MTKETKKCNKCGTVRPITDFYPHKNMKDGRLNKCRHCSVREASEWRRENRDRYNEYRRRLNKQEHRREMRSKHQKEYAQRNPEKSRAHSAVSAAIANGSIKRPETCSKCGDAGKIEGHHEDYSRPLDITWLCHICHNEIHNPMGD